MSATVLFGLDGGTFRILDRLMADGTMPNLRHFVASGVRAELRSTPHPITPPAWTTVMTGRSPGHHGVLDFVRAEERRGGLYFRITDSRDIRCETIWSLASRQNRRVTALNMYGTAPAPPVAGHVIPGFVPSRHLRRASHPRQLFERLAQVERLDLHALGMDLDEEKKCVQGLAPERYEDWVALHIHRERQWLEVLRYLMKSDPSHLVAIVFDGVDKLQHLCWRFIDGDAEAPDAPWERKIRQLCRDYFRQVDEILAEAIALAGPDGRIFVVSDHGFGPTTEVVYINVWLERQGLLSWTADAPKDEGGRIMVDRLKNHVSMLDWPSTRAYALTPSSNGIFIRGVPSSEYPRFRTELITALEGFVDPGTGQRIITEIRTREQAFPGAQSGLAPDLILTLRDGGLVSILNADVTLRPRAEPMGTHRPEGIFIAGGAGIRQGVVLPPLDILDVAPTLLHSIGLPVPQDFEGRVPGEIFERAVHDASPPRFGPPTRPVDGAPAVAADTLDAEAEAVILDRLRSLGYLE